MSEPITHGCRVVVVKGGDMWACDARDQSYLDARGQCATAVYLHSMLWSRSVEELRAEGYELHVTYNPKQSCSHHTLRTTS